MTPRQRQFNRRALAVGVVATLVATLFHAAGGLDRVELFLRDLRFQHASTIRARDDIVLIEIDDRSLDLGGRWPWSRDRQAALLSIPAEAGATALLVDLTYVEPEPIGTRVSPGDALLPNAAETDPAERTFPDAALADAIAAAGNVYLAFHFPPTDAARSAEMNAAITALLAGDEESAAEAIAVQQQRYAALVRQGIVKPSDVDAGGLAFARLAAALERDPALEPEALPEHVPEAPLAWLKGRYGAALEAACRRLAGRWLSADPARLSLPPDVAFQQAYADVIQRPIENRSAVRAAFSNAVLENLALAAMRETAFAPRSAAPVAFPIDAVVPVQVHHARVARRTGFVNFRPDVDGVIRRQNLFVRTDAAVFPQLALALACDRLGVAPGDIRVEEGALVLQPPGRDAIRIQLDADGRAQVPWVPSVSGHTAYARVGAAELSTIAELRRLIAYNERVMRTALGAMVARSELAAEYAQLDQRRGEAAQRRDAARLSGDRAAAADAQRAFDEADAQLAEHEARFVDGVTDSYRRYFEQGETPEDPEIYDRVGFVMEVLSDLMPYSLRNEEMTRTIEERMARLRELLGGKVCLLGYTATSLADAVPIPTISRAPGMLAHADFLNGVLSNRLVRLTPPWLDAALAIVLGIAASLLAVRLRPHESGPATAAVGLLFFAGAMGVFYAFTWMVAVSAPLFAVLCSYAGVFVFRYIFVDSERRQLATSLSQYTSREIARQVAENPELCQRAEMREVTAMFTDLRGFTGISERIGAERTQRVLNVCLGEFTEVMLRHEAMVNKFIGDGVFAFWNPVIYPQPDHAERACETALDLLDAMQRLRKQQRTDGEQVFDELFLRVGVATGNAIVGPCGSEQKYDYTCIGDSVNVAARLESANKFYGTSVLVSDAARAQAGEQFVFRALGGVRVKGKQNALPIFELLGRRGAVPDADLEYAERFAEAIRVFQSRQWRAALEHFERIAAERPDDAAASNYVEACVTYLASPPPANWTGAIELQEK